MKILRVIFMLLLAFSCQALADERILSFHSDVTVNWDGSLDVVETIHVRAEQNIIKRGIYRDFPTRYRDNAGRLVEVGFFPLAVKRDGIGEPNHTERRSNGIRIYFGSADHYLPTGNYTYTFNYKTTGHLGYFSDFDEIYWNVTGNGWEFPIEQASARVVIPGQFDPTDLRIAGYTGPQGAKGSDVEYAFKNGAAYFQTTALLGKYEGLTVAVGFPKGLVRQPTAADLRIKTLKEYAPTVIAVVFFVLTMLVNGCIWWRVGRDPAKGTIIPRFKPPANMSPAACRFIMQMGYDSKCFAASLIHLAVNGWVTLKQDATNYSVTLKSAAGKQRYSCEDALLKELFSRGNTLVFKNSNHRVINRSLEALKRSLSAEHVNISFRTNRIYIIASVIMVLLSMLGILIATGDPAILISGVILAFCLCVLTAMLNHTVNRWLHSSKGLISKLFSTLFAFIFSLVIGLIAWGATKISNIPIDLTPAGIAAFVATIAQMPLFFILFKRPTESGQKLRDEIEGFKLYLTVAERDQLAMMKGPEKTPELFEKFLPYALALGVEQEWSEQFTEILAAASIAPDNRNTAYRPAWYVGKDWKNATAFSAAMGGQLNSAISSSSVPPGSTSGSSSSGSSGGGSSGGGGGGGGGGGW